MAVHEIDHSRTSSAAENVWADPNDVNTGLDLTPLRTFYRFKIDPLVNFSSPQNLVLPAPAHRPFSCL